MPASPWLRRMVMPIADRVVYASKAYASLKSSVNDLAGQLIDFSAEPGGPADTRLREAVALLHPMEASNLRPVRVGGAGDGGYVMADLFGEVTGAVSIGVGPDVSWDADIARRGIRVVMFDPTVRRLPAQVPNGQFHRVGIGPIGSSGTYRSLGDLVALSGYASDANLLLKIDVEGAEWTALAGLSAADLVCFSQIVIELHGLDELADEPRAERMLSVLRTLTAGHTPTHVHANNYSELRRFDRYWFPTAIEVSFVRSDVLADVHPAQAIASPLDRPCDPDTAEITLEGILTLHRA